MSALANEKVSSASLDIFERKLRETLCELSEKRGQSTEHQQKMQELVLAQNDLKRNLNRVQSELLDTKKQLWNAVAAVHSTGEQLNSKTIQESSIVTKLEVATRERDLLLQQTREVSLENVTLKQKIEDLETKQRYVGKIEDNVSSMKSAFTASVDEVTREIKRLEDDHKQVEVRFECAKKISEELRRDNQHVLLLLKEATEKEDATKLQKLEHDHQISPQEDYENRIRQLTAQWQGWLQNLSDAVACDRKNAAELRKAMLLMDKNLEVSQELEELANQELSAEQQKNEALNKTLQDIQLQLRNTKAELEEKQNSPKRPVYVDFSTQTSPAKSTSKCIMVDFE